MKDLFEGIGLGEALGYLCLGAGAVIVILVILDALKVHRNAPGPDAKPLPRPGSEEDDALYDGLILSIIAIEPPQVVQAVVEAAAVGEYGGGGVRARLDAAYTAIVVKGVRAPTAEAEGMDTVLLVAIQAVEPPSLVANIVQAASENEGTLYDRLSKGYREITGTDGDPDAVIGVVYEDGDECPTCGHSNSLHDAHGCTSCRCLDVR
jgi:hypothetical protein